MKKNNSLLERWKKRLEEKSKLNPSSRENFNADLKNLIIRTAKIVATNHEQNEEIKSQKLTDNQILNLLDGSTPNITKEKEKVVGHYSRSFNRIEWLQDTRKQEDWATTKDLLKVFFSRVATAFSIGLVILFINWLAHLWGIPFTFIKIG